VGRPALSRASPIRSTCRPAIRAAASDPGQDTISAWHINWGDGSVDDLAGNPASVSHTYGASGSMAVSAVATDEDDSYSANTLQLQVLPAETLKLTSLTPTASGFHVRFNRAIDTTVLNLYDSQAAQLGAPDVTLVGVASGAAKGSLIVDVDGRRRRRRPGRDLPAHRGGALPG